MFLFQYVLSWLQFYFYFIGLDFFPASSLNFDSFCHPEEARLRIPRISHLPA